MSWSKMDQNAYTLESGHGLNNFDMIELLRWASNATTSCCALETKAKSADFIEILDPIGD